LSLRYSQRDVRDKHLVGRAINASFVEQADQRTTNDAWILSRADQDSVQKCWQCQANQALFRMILQPNLEYRLRNTADHFNR
jgi:hypothetical protein